MANFISGTAGSGKSFLLNILGKALEETGKEIKYGVVPFYHQEDKDIMRQKKNVVYFTFCQMMTCRLTQ